MRKKNSKIPDLKWKFRNSMCEKIQNCYRQRIYIYWINFLTSKRKRRGSCGDMCGVCIDFSYDKKKSLIVYLERKRFCLIVCHRDRNKKTLDIHSVIHKKLINWKLVKLKIHMTSNLVEIPHVLSYQPPIKCIEAATN